MKDKKEQSKIALPANDADTMTEVESNAENSFFYTNDKFINGMDDDEIIEALIQHFPGMKFGNTDALIKEALITAVNNVDFINSILKYYNISIYDLFKLLYKKYGSIFKGPFLKKLKLNLIDKNYPITHA